MNLEIVSHCWHYSRLLNYQLSSLIAFAPTATNVIMTVFLTPEDEQTVRVVDYFSHLAEGTSVAIRPWPLARPELMRREIGRNLAALATHADWIWFTDCDHCFGSQSLDALGPALRDVAGPLAFPQHIWIHKTHALGDAAIDRLPEVPAIATLIADEFVQKQNHRAIGGLQIARGEVMRNRGYLKNSKIQRQTANTWQRCIGDTRFRRDLNTPGTGIDIPNLFRIRHSRIGRKEADLRL